MKKNLIKSAIISFVITGIGCLTNFLFGKFGDNLLFKVTSNGGEYQGQIGFGILLEKLFPLTNDPDKAGTIRHLSFDIINFLIYLILIFGITFATIKVIEKIKEGKKKNKKKSNKKEK